MSFSVKEKFVENTKSDAEVKISYISKDFQKRFGSNVETGIGEREVILLSKDIEETPSFFTAWARAKGTLATDSDLVASIGIYNEFSSLESIYRLMKVQRNRTIGKLLVDGSANHQWQNSTRAHP